jgi:cytochrome c peroxidase
MRVVESEENVVVKKVAKTYIANFYEFQEQVNILSNLANKTTLISELRLLKIQVEKTRLAYKKIEFIFDYYQTPYNGTYINGAPLPKISEYFESDVVIKPCGLQALDEVVFETPSKENLEHIKILANQLKQKVDVINEMELPIHFKSSQIIEAIRSGLIRVFTLGLTGYDTPGSGNGIKESYESFKSMKNAFVCFSIDLDKDAKVTFESVNQLFCKGENLLNSNISFNDFNRLVFLKEIINPLYSQLLEFQGLNKIKLESYKKHAQNYRAKNIFDVNFLNSSFYSELVYLPLDNLKSIALGKLLFEDSRLSNGNKISCLSCHNPNLGFTDGLPKSASNRQGVFVKRNSPSLLNTGYSTRYFWDMRAFNLEKQVAHVIDNELEFNTSFDAIVQKLSVDSNYSEKFKLVYGGIAKNDINRKSISNALAAYVNSLKSFNSPFDKYVRNEIREYPEKAKRGFNLFMGKGACGSCHFAPVFNGTVPPFYLESESEVLGVTKGFDSINPKLDEDLGRYNNKLKGDNQFYLKNAFKTVSVRNISLTGPYMHNGLFNTLEEVLEFYNLGGGAGMGLEVDNQTLSDKPLGLTKQEITDIIAFMETLTDVSGV